LERHGYDVLATALRDVINYPKKQRAGGYGTAKQIGSFLTSRQGRALGHAGHAARGDNTRTPG
jgi:hypothetical protein